MSRTWLRPALAVVLPLALLAGATVAAGAAPASSASALEERAAELDGTLSAEFAPVRQAAVGRDVAVSGRIVRLRADGQNVEATGVPASFGLQLSTPDGNDVAIPGRFETAADGTFTVTVPGAASAGMAPDADTNYRETAALRAVDVRAGDTEAAEAGSGALTFFVEAGLQVENSFVTSVGWVKPDDEYTSQIFVRNFDAAPVDGVSVTVPPADGTTVLSATPNNAGTATVAPDGTITWQVGTVPAGGDAGPAVLNLIVRSQADNLATDEQVVFKNLATTATMTPGGATSTAHGPKVIPQEDTFNTYRYGDRPFPVVPVDFFDFKHLEESGGDKLFDAINGAENAGSTFNLYQEMSYGQLYPQASIGSAGVETADFTYEPGFRFTQVGDDPVNTNTCQGGFSASGSEGSALYNERISDGFYQLPGNTAYYGSDSGGTAITGSFGVPGSSIDNGCGETGKAVFDAANIADPEIDYSDFDTDKDGVVDFFMMVYVGCGGNGVSQLSVVAECPNAPSNPTGGPGAPYDNIWPHSSTLESGYFDPETGLSGYVSDDQLKDFDGTLLYYTDANRVATTREVTEFPVMVRVGPYNVNPETSIEKASVISHEYGHSLGLPDYYSNGGLDLYSEWNLMASDYGQSMDVQARQEMGWVIPRVLPEGETIVEDMVDSKQNIGTIDWQTPDGDAYTLRDGVNGPVDNGEAYVAKLPARRVIDPALVEEGASPEHVYWSGSGDNFGCIPQARNIDFALPQLEEVAPGTPITLTYKSLWDIEWDFDYGFTLVTVDAGATYNSLPSENGYTTPATTNPNANSCQARFSNGLTGTSGSYEAGTQQVDRIFGNYPPGRFLEDEYDLTEFAGSKIALRFSYSTDPGVARPAWFIDDIKVTAGDEVLYESNVEDPEDPTVFQGGCNGEGLMTAPVCTEGFVYLSAAEGSTADHAYYMELRDRSGFDEIDGKGESDRGEIRWKPGLSLAFTDETFSYGNVSQSQRPGQHILDSKPEARDRTPNLDDAAWTADDGDNVFTDSGEGHVDNFRDPARDDGMFRFDFNCLSFEVLEMAGEDVAPEGNLTADVKFTRGPGCAPFNYGVDYENLGEPRDGTPPPPGDGGGQQPPPTIETAERIAGDSRIDTAVAASQKAYPNGTGTAILARADEFPDALAGATLAAQLDAPILLTPTDQVAPEVDAELERLGAETVYLLGGEAALDAGVESTLAADYSVERLEGPDRFETAGEIAREVVATGSGSVSQVVLARGDNFADALSAGNIGTNGRAPVLLTPSDTLGPAARQALADVMEVNNTVYLAGGDVALSEAVADQVRQEGYRVQRLAGENRYETGVEIAREASIQFGIDAEPAVLASGGNFPDALTAAPLAHTVGGSLILVDPEDLSASAASQTFLADRAQEIDTLLVAGGPQALADAVVEQAREATADS